MIHSCRSLYVKAALSTNWHQPGVGHQTESRSFRCTKSTPLPPFSLHLPPKGYQLQLHVICCVPDLPGAQVGVPSTLCCAVLNPWGQAQVYPPCPLLRHSPTPHGLEEEARHTSSSAQLSLPSALLATLTYPGGHTHVYSDTTAPTTHCPPPHGLPLMPPLHAVAENQSQPYQHHHPELTLQPHSSSTLTWLWDKLRCLVVAGWGRMLADPWRMMTLSENMAAQGVVLAYPRRVVSFGASGGEWA